MKALEYDKTRTHPQLGYAKRWWNTFIHKQLLLEKFGCNEDDKGILTMYLQLFQTNEETTA